MTDGGELLVELGLFDPGAAIDKELVFKVEDGVAVRAVKQPLRAPSQRTGPKFFPVMSALRTAIA